MKPKEIAFVIYSVTDLARSREFYEKVLNLKSENVWIDEKTGFGMVEYALGKNGEHTIAIGSGMDNFKPGQNGAAASIEVEDFAEAVAALKSAGVKFKMEPMESPVCHMAVFLDLDGNQIMLHQRKNK